MLVVAGGFVLVVRCDDDLVTRVDRIVLIVDCVSCSDFRPFLGMLS